MGYQWVSYTLGWDTAELTPGNYQWGDADNIANGARSAGINALIRVSRTCVGAGPGLPVRAEALTPARPGTQTTLAPS